MKFMAVSGSGRQNSTNTALLCALARVASPDHSILVYDRIAQLPVFTPDLENGPLPDEVRHFSDQVRACDGIIISSPEYIRSIPGGLKNGIDWLVSRDEIISKPIALLHASHRGDDMLAQLRTVLTTVSDRFNASLFGRFNLMDKSPEEITRFFERRDNRHELTQFLSQFVHFCSLQDILRALPTGEI